LCPERAAPPELSIRTRAVIVQDGHVLLKRHVNTANPNMVGA